jgi:hypothetical protein
VGLATNFVSSLLGELSDFSTQANNIATAFNDDAQSLVWQVQDLAGCASGPSYDALCKASTSYQSQVGGWLDPLTQVRAAAQRYHDTINQASQQLDGTVYWPDLYDTKYQVVLSEADIINLVFSQYLTLDTVLSQGSSVTSSAFTSAQEALAQQKASQQQPYTPQPMPGFDDGYEARTLLNAWADSLQQATQQWQVTVAVHAYEEGSVPKLAGVNPNPALVAGITNEFNSLDPYGQISTNDSFTSSITPQQYQQVVSTYNDPRTQEALLILMTTPTGAKFAQYLLYMGKKVGQDFISWQHLGTGNSAPGAVTTYGGYIQLNLDTFSDMPTEAGYLVHEGLESYFKTALGIREMGSQHADYLADWEAGKFWHEYNGSSYGSYGQTFNTWINGNGSWYRDTAHEPVNTNIHNIDTPGYIWHDSAEQSIGSFFGQHWGETNVGTPPNPMGLTPQMLTTNDLSTLDPLPKN